MPKTVQATAGFLNSMKGLLKGIFYCSKVFCVIQRYFLLFKGFLCYSKVFSIVQRFFVLFKGILS